MSVPPLSPVDPASVIARLREAVNDPATGERMRLAWEQSEKDFAALLREGEEQGRELAELSDYRKVIETDLFESPSGAVVYLRIGGERFGFGAAEVPNILAGLRSLTPGGAE